MGRRRFLQILTGLGAFFGGLFRPLIAGGQVAPTVTAEPNTLTLLPGGSAQVTVTVDPASAYGTGSVTITVEVPYNGTIAGDFAGVVPAGEHWHITGDVNLTGDLIVEGLLTGISAFTLTGNGYQILVQNGGQLDLAGVPKSAWLRWGDNPIGWQTGDRLAVAPTVVGVYVPSETTWGGSWSSTVRSGSSSDVSLVDGSTARPEVANLSQTIVLRNLRRVHFQNGADIQSLRWVRVLDCGTAGVLGDYPIHFHLNGEASRGSVIGDVVVEGGKNHAFVPHGSHGITFTRCVAYKNLNNDAFWWDPPLSNNAPDPNETHDLFYDRCLALGITGAQSPASIRLTGFNLGRGNGNRCVGSVAVGVTGGQQSSGFSWPEAGVGVWEFRNCVAHNNKYDGIFTWQNTVLDHVVEDFAAYRNGKAGVEHGAYLNFYLYRNLVLSQNLWTFQNHALSWDLSSYPTKRLIVEDVLSDGPLLIGSHNQTSIRPTFYKRCQFTGVTYTETNPRWSFSVFEDCGLTPADFTLTLIRPESVIEIYEAGLLVHRWQSGVWS